LNASSARLGKERRKFDALIYYLQAAIVVPKPLFSRLIPIYLDAVAVRIVEIKRDRHAVTGIAVDVEPGSSSLRNPEQPNYQC